MPSSRTTFTKRLSRFAREVHFGSWVVWLYMLFLLAVFGGATIGLAVRQYNNIRLDQSGVDVRGKVTDKSTRSTDDGVEYIIEYTYDAGFGDPPDVRSGRQTVSKSFYDRHAISEPITVTFLPDDRGISRAEPDKNRVLRLIFLAVMGLIALSLLVLVVVNGVVEIQRVVLRLLRQ